MNLKELKRLKTIREIKKGGKSKYVILLEGNVIKKKYDKTKPEHIKHFEHEVIILNHLKAQGAVEIPNIIATDKEDLTIYMDFCGDNPQDTAVLQQNLAVLMKKFRDIYGLYRYEIVNGNKILVDKIGLHNVCEKDGKLFLIDFGSNLWVLNV
mgnify:CR=1 FL=1